MSFALTLQATWPCSVCGEEYSWKDPPIEVRHQQHRTTHRFVCRPCVQIVVEMLSSQGDPRIPLRARQRSAA